MFDDKKLEKMLRRQVKTGLTIYVGGDEIAFVSSNWMARTTMERLREKLRITLGALVEMLGFIPEDGAIRIRKNKDGYDVQEEMMTVAANQISTFLARTLWPVKRTALSYGWARELWQTRDGTLYGQTADRVDDGGNTAWLNGADCLVLRDLNNCEEQYIKVSRPEDDVGIVHFDMWQHLEEVMWTDWSDSPAAEEEPEEEQFVLVLPAPEEEPEEKAPEIPMLPPAEERDDEEEEDETPEEWEAEDGAL